MIIRHIGKIKTIILFAFFVLVAVFSCTTLFGCSNDGGKTDNSGKTDGDNNCGDYILRYFAEDGGYLEGEGIQLVNSGETGATVKAVPEKGYLFSAWSDGVETAERVDEDVTSNITVKAYFEKIKYSVKYFSDENGTVDGKTEQTVAYREYAEYVTAVPNEGYEFYKWSDGLTYATRREQEVKADVSVTAIFRLRRYWLRYNTGTDGGKITGETVQTLMFGESGTTVTAIASEGYEFMGWTDGVKTAERTDENVSKDINVLATFRRKRFELIYKTSDNFYGSVREKTRSYDTNIIEKTVYAGSEITVTAKPKRNYKDGDFTFICWSDGVTTAERTDTVTEDLTLIAYFGYEIDYTVNNGVGGRIEGKTKQKLLPEDVKAVTEAPDRVSETVTAVPDDGYVFCGWSDLSMEPTREGDFVIKSMLADWYTTFEYVAYFEPTTKTFTYDYGDGVEHTETGITLNRNDIKAASFVVPSREGYVFCGWYADDDYNVRITDETGRYMYGNMAFSLDSDTLYARWRKADEKYDPHKILLVLVDRIDVELYSTKVEKNLQVHKRMCALDYMFVKWMRVKLSELLNEWFKDIVKIELDIYCTTETVDDKSVIDDGRTGSGNTTYFIYANKLQETVTLTYSYHNTITLSDFGEHNMELSLNSGVACRKHANVNFRNGAWYEGILNRCALQEIADGVINGRLYTTIIQTCLHELAHTAEDGLVDNKHTLHDALNYYDAYFDRNSIPNVIKPFLMGEFVADGEVYGIPTQYWRHQSNVPVVYGPKQVSMQPLGGEVIAISSVENTGSDGFMVAKVLYGSDVTVEAVPYSGYRFVKWTDGVTTAVRQDKNIISYLFVRAIFEKIT